MVADESNTRMLAMNLRGYSHIFIVLVAMVLLGNSINCQNASTTPVYVNRGNPEAVCRHYLEAVLSNDYKLAIEFINPKLRSTFDGPFNSATVYYRKADQLENLVREKFGDTWADHFHEFWFVLFNPARSMIVGPLLRIASEEPLKRDNIQIEVNGDVAIVKYASDDKLMALLKINNEWFVDDMGMHFYKTNMEGAKCLIDASISALNDMNYYIITGKINKNSDVEVLAGKWETFDCGKRCIRVSK